MKQYETFELTFSGRILSEDYADIPLTAVFSCGSQTKTVQGFYDGDGLYKVRFLPEEPGAYTWLVTGAVSAEGTEICQPADIEHHGLVKAVDTHFEFEDGKLFTPFGTTVYALAHQDDALVEQTLETLKAAPFNKVRMCVFPKDYDYNHNEPPYYAFEKTADGSWDVRRPCIAFWHRFETILERITEMGIQADLILFHPYDRWGFSALSREDNLLFLDYLLRRLSAKPGIWWSLANEYDLCAAKSLSDWEEIESFVAHNDPYGHLLSCHNCFCFWDAARPGITHASIQTKGLSELPRWIAKYQKPVIIDECCYEGNLPHFWGSISAREMVYRFWRCAASGAYCTHGETFLADDEVLWWAKGGILRGESPERIAFLRKIIESIPGPLTANSGGVFQLIQMSEQEIETTLSQHPEYPGEFIRLLHASICRMEADDRTVHLAGEHEWAAHAGDDAWLWFNDRQCFGEQTLQLPEGRHYRVELIDVWEMTSTVLNENACGTTKIRLPGKEGLAVLAVSQRGQVR